MRTKAEGKVEEAEAESTAFRGRSKIRKSKFADA